jgi:hypothetical protein
LPDDHQRRPLDALYEPQLEEPGNPHVSGGDSAVIIQPNPLGFIRDPADAGKRKSNPAQEGVEGKHQQEDDHRYQQEIRECLIIQSVVIQGYTHKLSCEIGCLLPSGERQQALGRLLEDPLPVEDLFGLL